MINYKEVYDALSFHEWRNALELVEIIANKRSVDKFRLYPGPIYIYLHSLCEEGHADRRERQLTPEQLKVRRNKGYEYKLTQDGLGKKVEIEQQSAEGIEATLVPAEV